MRSGTEVSFFPTAVPCLADTSSSATSCATPRRLPFALSDVPTRCPRRGGVASFAGAGWRAPLALHLRPMVTAGSSAAAGGAAAAAAAPGGPETMTTLLLGITRSTTDVRLGKSGWCSWLACCQVAGLRSGRAAACERWRAPRFGRSAAAPAPLHLASRAFSCSCVWSPRRQSAASRSPRRSGGSRVHDSAKTIEKAAKKAAVTHIESATASTSRMRLAQ